jgi:hypothetical protein
VAHLHIAKSGRLHSVEVQREHHGRHLPELMLAVAREACEKPVQIGEAVSEDVREWFEASEHVKTPQWWTDVAEDDDTWQKFVWMPGDTISLEEAYERLAGDTDDGPLGMDDDERLELLAMYTRELNKDGRAVPQLTEPVRVRMGDRTMATLKEAYARIEAGESLDGLQLGAEQRTKLLAQIGTILDEQDVER